MADAENLLWWQKGVFYNLYVRSFKDTNGDGVGDLPGVIEKLDYLHDLGVDVLWISGMLDSPWLEFGFDVRDYTAIQPTLGNLEVFDDLLRQAHQRGMQVIIDFIPNHTSSEHPWFIESRSSRNNPKRGWYHWVDPRPDGSPPNNWLSLFGGSQWEWDETTGQFYQHTFLKQQPDLNWRNPDLREAMKGVLRFWLERGVDGFRVDAAHHIIKDVLLRDNPPNPNPRVIDGRTIENETQLHLYDREVYELHSVYRELREVIDSYSTPEQPRAWFAEVHPAGWGAWIQYFGCAGAEFNFPFNNGFIFTQWKALDVRILIDTIEALLPLDAWPNAHTGNFDEWRMVTRVGKEQARVAAMLLMTLRGSPLLYYGEEIGMHNVEVPEEMKKDRMGLQVGLSRDPQRTPMQWSNAKNAGFSNAPPEDCWLPVGADYDTLNAEVEREDPKSMLHLYRSLIACRRSTPALLDGSYRPVEVNTREVFAFLREKDTQRMLVTLNFSDQLINLNLPRLGKGKILLSTFLERNDPINLASLEVYPNEGLVIELE
jgi:alpha-glucosidase